MKPKTIIIVVSVLAVLALIAAVANAYANNRRNSDPNYDPAQPKSETTKAPVLDYDKKIGFGSKGEEVKELQRLYNNSKYASTKLDDDGKAGAKTISAIVIVMGFGVTSTTLKAFKAKLEASAASAETKSFLGGLLGIKF